MIVLYIFPHPDDETIFAGGTIARHVAEGDKVIWICASYGERGGEASRISSRLFYFVYLFLGYFPFLVAVQNFIIWWLSIFRKPNKSLAETRKLEAKKVAELYGVQFLHFLDVPDMKFSKNEGKIIQKIAKYIKSCNPRVIYTLHPNGITGHPDHIVLSEAVISATKNITSGEKPQIFGATISKETIKKFRLPLIGADVDEISKEVLLNESELAQKSQAINIYKSQKYLWEIFLQKCPELLEKEHFVRLN